MFTYVLNGDVTLFPLVADCKVIKLISFQIFVCDQFLTNRVYFLSIGISAGLLLQPVIISFKA